MQAQGTASLAQVAPVAARPACSRAPRSAAPQKAASGTRSSAAGATRRLVISALVGGGAMPAVVAAAAAAADGTGSNRLLIVGPGVLGSYLGKLWVDENGAGSVVGQTNSTTNHAK